MADLINVGAFPNDVNGDPARTAFQKINGFAAGTVPIPALLIGPPTTNVPALTVVNQFGFDAIDVNLNQMAGQGFAINIVGSSAADVRGVQVTNSQSGATAGCYGFLVGNDGFNEFIMGKTSSTFAGSKFPGSPAGEISWLQSGGNIPISMVVGASPVQVLGLANSQITMFGTAVTGGNTLLISNTSAVDGDTARLQVTTPTSAVALFAANAAQSVAIVAGGPTGAQGVLRNLGAYPLVFGTANTYRGQISGAGAWIIAAPLAGNTALTVNGVAGNASGNFISPNSAGNSFGLNVVAGTNASDFAFAIQNAAQTANLLKLFGDGGLVVGNTVTGGDKGPGTINCSGLFVNGVAVTVP